MVIGNARVMGRTRQTMHSSLRKNFSDGCVGDAPVKAGDAGPCSLGDATLDAIRSRKLHLLVRPS
jgi:hypothetical protein